MNIPKRTLLDYDQFLAALQEENGAKVLYLEPSLECRALAWMLCKGGLIPSVHTEMEFLDPNFNLSLYESMLEDPALMSSVKEVPEAPAGYYLSIERPVGSVTVQRNATTTILIARKPPSDHILTEAKTLDNQEEKRIKYPREQRAVQRKIQGHEHEGSGLTLVEFESLMDFIVDKTGTDLHLATYTREQYKQEQGDDLLPVKKAVLVLRFKRAYSSKKIEKILNESSIKEFSFHEDKRKFDNVDYAFESWSSPSIKDWTNRPDDGRMVCYPSRPRK